MVKIGGSNLKNLTSIQQIISVLKLYETPPVIVLSAFFGVTNDLISILDHSLKDENKVNELIDAIQERKHQTLEHYISNPIELKKCKAELEKLIQELRKYIYGINYIGEIPDFLYDKILSYGERLSALCISQVLNSNDVPALMLSPNELGLITNGELRNASIDFKASAEKLSIPEDTTKVLVVPGFYGFSPEGKVNLLGRGGTDYAAASIAKLTSASSLDVWKDVDGFMSVDPKICNDPQPIKHLSYGEAAELAYLGAKILHPRTVEPLIDVNIPIRLFNIEGELSLEPLTIVDQNQSSNIGIKSITCSDQFAVLKINGPGLGIKAGMLNKISEVLSNAEININAVISSHISINMLIDKSDLKKAHRSIADMNLADIHSIECKEDLAVIALVGQGMMEDLSIITQVFDLLKQNNIDAKLSSLGASEVVCYLFVKQNLKDDCIRLIHQNFFN